MNGKSWKLIGLAVAFQIISGMPLPAQAALENHPSANIVVGQPDFNTTSRGTSATTFNFSTFVSHIGTDGTGLLVPDTNNHRVLIYKRIPDKNGAAADIVLGQADFLGSTNGRNSVKMDQPVCAVSDGIRLAVCDRANSRVLIWNSMPTVNGQPADVVVGQTNFSNGGSGVTASTLSFPRAAGWIGQKFLIVDTNNNRVLVFNQTPTTNGASADLVIGQPNFTSNGIVDTTTGAVSARSLRLAGSGATPVGSEEELIIADSANNRILIYRPFPTTSYPYAKVVLGQPNFTSTSNNADGPTERSMRLPEGVGIFGKSLLVLDTTNNRVLVYDNIPEENFAPAHVLIGQSDFSNATSCNPAGGITAKTICAAEGMTISGRHLLIADSSFANRVLIFDLLAGMQAMQLGPQFNQGKAVLGKVFADTDGDGWQEEGEIGLEGVRVASDTGIFAITDPDGKYHFPSLEVGQRLLKIDETTLPAGSAVTTSNPHLAVVTAGVLTKVSFGVKVPAEALAARTGTKEGPLLKVAVSQDPVRLQRELAITGKKLENRLQFLIRCNYHLFVARSELVLYNAGRREIKRIETAGLLPYQYEVNPADMPSGQEIACYQLMVYDQDGRVDRTTVGCFEPA